MYILRFLHQTTTNPLSNLQAYRCISCVFYIKPQHNIPILCQPMSCISCVFYIKPQLFLYLCLRSCRCISCVFYIKPQLNTKRHKQLYKLYILRFLHQTTTYDDEKNKRTRCISCVFYIKPQQLGNIVLFLHVVYLAFSTSNHNSPIPDKTSEPVVYLAFSTSNHNVEFSRWSETAVVYLAFSTSNHNFGCLY